MKLTVQKLDLNLNFPWCFRDEVVFETYAIPHRFEYEFLRRRGRARFKRLSRKKTENTRRVSHVAIPEAICGTLFRVYYVTTLRLFGFQC